MATSKKTVDTEKKLSVKKNAPKEKESTSLNNELDIKHAIVKHEMSKTQKRVSDELDEGGEIHYFTERDAKREKIKRDAAISMTLCVLQMVCTYVIFRYALKAYEIGRMEAIQEVNAELNASGSAIRF